MTGRIATIGAALATFITAIPSLAAELNLPRQSVELMAPPFVHAHEQATSQRPKIIEFRLVVEEKEVVIDEQGTKLQAMTFNGSIPAPMMVVHEDDYVEVTLVNPATNTMPHNVDFHAATGALGGAELTLINPGEQVVLRWKATRSGTFVYHCAPGGPMTPWPPVAYAVTMLGLPTAMMIEPELVTLPLGAVTYRPAGDYARDGKPMNAPLKTVRFAQALRSHETSGHANRIPDLRRRRRMSICSSCVLDFRR